jgi:SpoVK/Ycf46/Vps4 family AAA+-type ATPase
MGNGVSVFLDSGYPVLYMPTAEQERALHELMEDLKANNLANQLQIYLWKSTIGLYPYRSDSPEEERVAGDLLETLKFIASGTDGMPQQDHLYVLFNPKDFLSTPQAKQAFRDAAYAIRTVSSHIICIGATYEVPEELDDVVTMVDFDLPDKEQIKTLFSGIVDKYKDKLKLEVKASDLDMAAENTLGLTMLKAENAISRSLVESRGLDLDLLRMEKQQAVKQSGVLEYVPHVESIETLGGFDVLKEHVSKRRKYYENVEEATKFGLRPPKGVMLVGLPGTGKSLASKTASYILELPLYRFNMGALFKGIVGSSEANTRNNLKLLERVAPCVVEFDEFEKGFAGLESSGKTDSGVTSRVVQQILTWMQECTKPIYKFATCNTIRNLDGALFRRGRWDGVFGVELPTYEERIEIFAIHLTKRGRDPEEFDLQKLATKSVDFVGAEIESAVDDAMYTAYDEGRDIATDDIVKVCKDLIPLSKTDKEGIQAFRTWIDSRATRVSSGRSKAAQKGSGKKGRSLRVFTKEQKTVH